MINIFEFTEKPRSLPIKLQFMSEDQNYGDKFTIQLTYGSRCFITLTSLAPHFFVLDWLKLTLILLLDQL